jgi:hypothetical protein
MTLEHGFLPSRLSLQCFSLFHISCLVSCVRSVKEFSLALMSFLQDFYLTNRYIFHEHNPRD